MAAAAHPLPQPDLFPLFAAITDAVTHPPREGRRPRVFDAIEYLSMQPEVLTVFLETPIRTIREVFRAHSAERALNADFSHGCEIVLSKLYDIALINSETSASLNKLIQCIPDLKRLLSGYPRRKIENARAQAEEILLTRPSQKASLEDLQSQIRRTQQVKDRIDTFRALLPYIDYEANQRVYDLARSYQRRGLGHRCARIFDEYPHIVRTIRRSERAIQNAAPLVHRLHEREVLLMQMQGSLLEASAPAEHPLQARFINAFSEALYPAFGILLWNALRNSRVTDPEMRAQIDTMEDADRATGDDVDFAFLNTACTSLYPDFDWERLMLHTLDAMDPNDLDALEESLQTLARRYNEILEAPGELHEVKRMRAQPIKGDMQAVCFEAIRDRFAHLRQVFTFLDQ